MSGPIVQSVDVNAIFQRVEAAAKKTLREAEFLLVADVLAKIEHEVEKLKAIANGKPSRLSDIAIIADTVAAAALIQVVLLQAHAQAVVLEQAPTAGSIH